MGQVWWATLLAQAKAIRDLAAALLRVVPYQGDMGACPPDKLDIWYATHCASDARRATEGSVEAAEGAQDAHLLEGQED